MKRVRRLLLAATVLCLSVQLTGCVVVEDGTVGVKKTFGKISEESLKPGIQLNIPVFREVEVWDVKTQRLASRISVPSSEGLIVGIETSLLFRPVDVVAIRTKVGADYVQRFLQSTVVNVFREVVGQQKVEDLIKSQERLTTTVAENLRKAVEGRGVTIEELLVTELRLPQKFKDAVERKLESEQKALQKQFELEQAKKDAEIEVARAQGVAEAQKIISSTISSAYLQYLWISTLNENPNVIYVATEANMPVFRTVPGGPKG